MQIYGTPSLPYDEMFNYMMILCLYVMILCQYMVILPLSMFLEKTKWLTLEL